MTWPNHSYPRDWSSDCTFFPLLSFSHVLSPIFSFLCQFCKSCTNPFLNMTLFYQCILFILWILLQWMTLGRCSLLWGTYLLYYY
jgi:hypothetical protein